jgi:hypothetical protein
MSTRGARGWRSFKDPPPRSGRYMAYLLCGETYWLPEIEWDAELQAITWAEWTPETSHDPPNAHFICWRKLPPEPDVGFQDNCEAARYTPNGK